MRGTQGAQLIHMVLQRALGRGRYGAVVLACAAPLAVDAVLRHQPLQVGHARREQGLVMRGLAQFFERAANVVRHIYGKARVAARGVVAHGACVYHHDVGLRAQLGQAARSGQARKAYTQHQPVGHHIALQRGARRAWGEDDRPPLVASSLGRRKGRTRGAAGGPPAITGPRWSGGTVDSARRCRACQPSCGQSGSFRP